MSGKPDFLIVLSLERTASTSVFMALRRAARETPVLHVHFLDGDAYRKPPADAAEAAALDDKRRREAQVRAFLSDPSLEGAVFTILRDRLSRVVSGLWFAKHELLMSRYDPVTDRMDPDAIRAVSRRIDIMLDKERNYDRMVYSALGLPGRPKPGAYLTNSGARLFALDFRRLAEDFATATEAVFGAPIALQQNNGGAGIGDPRGYAAFKRLCAEHLPPERLGLAEGSNAA